LLQAGYWQAYKRVTKDPITVRVFDSMKLRCYPDSGSASCVMYFGDFYEFDEMLFVRRFLRPGEAFIDGGANIGTYSLLAAKVVGPGGRVDAFEPDPLAAARLRENIALNHLRNVQVHEAALSDDPGSVRLLQGWDVSNRVAGPTESDPQTIQVQAVRLDDELDPDVTYAMAKLDLEGAEVAALLGANQHLSRANPPVWEFEAFENQLRKLGSSRHELVSMLSTLGYLFRRFNAASGRLESVEDAIRTHGNLLAIHKSAVYHVMQRIVGQPP
jgi:FkbM family methyltransferase